jgi:GNAT superfamily N-acetyltransferase
VRHVRAGDATADTVAVSATAAAVPPACAPAQDVSVRRVRPTDAAALGAFYEGLSRESRRARFLGWVGVSDGQSFSFCTPDHVHAEGFVAVHPVGGEEIEIVGHLCLEPAGPSELELAVAVADAWQGRGVGGALMRAALRWADERGYETILASCFADNVQVLRLLRAAPFPPIVQPADAGVVNVIMPLRGPLASAWSMPAGGLRALRARRASRLGARLPCRVVWRRTPRPGRGAGG